MKIIFFGTPQFAANVLSYLWDHDIDVVAVITKPDMPKGRSGALVPSPVKTLAQLRKPLIPIFQPERVSSADFKDILLPFNADLFVVVAYGEIMQQHLLDMPRLGCINLHASLLPKYRGAAPIQRCIMEGETETGATIMHMVKKMDAGDMIKTAKIPITNETTFGQLEEILCKAGSKVLLEVIHDFTSGSVQRIPQDHSLATYAPKIELEDCQIDWNRPAQELHNLVRGVNPYPGAWCWVEVRGKTLRLKVNRSVLNNEIIGIPGTILSYGSDGLIIACAKGSLQLLEVQLEGKRAMTAEDLMRGIPQTEFKIKEYANDKN